MVAHFLVGFIAIFHPFALSTKQKSRITNMKKKCCGFIRTFGKYEARLGEHGSKYIANAF